MGISGWIPFLKEKKEDLLLLKSMTTDEKQLEIIDKMLKEFDDNIKE